MNYKDNELIISIDGETNGPAPLVNSLWQFGAGFYDGHGNLLDTFEANLEEQDGTVGNPDTLVWWKEQEEKTPGLIQKIRSGTKPAGNVMREFETKTRTLAKERRAKPLVVAYPAGFDFTWLYTLLVKYNGQSCVGFSCLDMKTMAMTLLNVPYHDAAKRRFPKHWFNPKLRHTHCALDDALEQGYTFFQMRKFQEEMFAKMDAYKGDRYGSQFDHKGRK